MYPESTDFGHGRKLGTNEDLSSSYRNHLKKILGVERLTSNPTAGELDTGRSLELNGQLE